MLRRFLSSFWQQRRWRYGLLSIVAALSFSLALPAPSYGISWLELLLRGAQIYQLSNISDQQEVQLGQRINQQVVNQVNISQNRRLNRYLDDIGQRLARESGRSELPYTFQVVEDDSINAFATMGGFVYIHTGLMKTAANEAELASVVGHEIAHIVGRHAVEQMRQRAIASGLLSVAGLDESTAVNIGVELALNLPNSREDELEADQLGLENLRQAGYAPSGMVTFMEKLTAQNRSSVPSLLSTHPATEDRVKALRTQIDPTTANSGDGLNEQAYRRRIRPLLN